MFIEFRSAIFSLPAPLGVAWAAALIPLWLLQRALSDLPCPSNCWSRHDRIRVESRSAQNPTLQTP